MSFSRRLDVDLWLGFAGAESGSIPAPGLRHAADRRASARAERAAVAASGLAAPGYAVSRSHTQGRGAALVAPTGVRLGVDLVLPDRVSERHATAILCRAEWEALASEGALRPALAWGLKEAAAKATGEPARDFPGGVRIERGAVGIVVRGAGRCLTAGWLRLGGVLCIWVREW